MLIHATRTLRIMLLTLLAFAGATASAWAQIDLHVARLFAGDIEDPSDADELSRALAGLGTPAIAPVFEALATGVVDTAEAGLLELDPLRSTAALGAFAHFSPTGVRSFLVGRDRSQPDEAQRLAALAVYGLVGTEDDLRGMAAIAAPLDSGELIGLRVRGAFRDALELVFTRDVRALERLPSAFDVAHPTLQADLVGAVRAVRADGSLRCLEQLLGRAPELDLVVLAALRELVAAGLDCAQPRLAERVRAYLDDEELRTVHAAVLVLAELEDPRSVERLIELLETDDANLAASVEGALRQTARRDFGRDCERWRAWYEAESSWWAEAERRLLADLGSNLPARVARALNEVSEHRLFRLELELSLIEQLSGNDPGLVALTCAALSQLGSRGALPELAQLATLPNPPSPLVAEAAGQAYFRITGRRPRPTAP